MVSLPGDSHSRGLVPTQPLTAAEATLGREQVEPLRAQDAENVCKRVGRLFREKGVARPYLRLLHDALPVSH